MSRQFVFWDTNTDPCLWYWTWIKERERRRKNSSPLSVTGWLWHILDKNLMARELLMFHRWLYSSRPGCPHLSLPTLKHLLSRQGRCIGTQTNSDYTCCTVIFPSSVSSLFPSPLWSILHSNKSVLEPSFTFKILMFWRKVLQVIIKLLLIFSYSFEDFPKILVARPQRSFPKWSFSWFHDCRIALLFTVLSTFWIHSYLVQQKDRFPQQWKSSTRARSSRSYSVGNPKAKRFLLMKSKVYSKNYTNFCKATWWTVTIIYKGFFMQ